MKLDEHIFSMKNVDLDTSQNASLLSSLGLIRTNKNEGFKHLCCLCYQVDMQVNWYTFLVKYIHDKTYRKIIFINITPLKLPILPISCSL